MREILDVVRGWRAEGRRVVLARVIGVDGSGPRAPGATMAVADDGEVAGSVSGGCVEGAVVAEAMAVHAGERGAGAVRFGYSDDEAFAVGLTCGGTIEVLVAAAPRDDVLSALAAALEAAEPATLLTVVDGPYTVGSAMAVTPAGAWGTLGHPELDRIAARDAAGTAVRRFGAAGEARKADVAVFVESFAPPPRMVIFGAVDFTAALADVACVLGYRVTVCDPRPVFATATRFPNVDEVVVAWPDAYLAAVGQTLGPADAVCVLTHDPKFDVPAIRAALSTQAGYIGAMGSRRTHAERGRRLLDAGVPAADLARVMGPIGLDIGARSPAEVAIAICAEIVALRAGRKAPHLRDGNGPVH